VESMCAQSFPKLMAYLWFDCALAQDL